jgi:hypothetical protein
MKLKGQEFGFSAPAHLEYPFLYSTLYMTSARTNSGKAWRYESTNRNISRSQGLSVIGQFSRPVQPVCLVINPVQNILAIILSYISFRSSISR